MKIKEVIPMNLQFFAEGDGEGAPEGNADAGAENDKDTGNNDTPSVEELMAQLAKERATNAKNKNALDKALKETGELKKSLRAKQTAEEQAEEAKKEQEEQRQAYIGELELYKRTNEAKERYLLQGMNAELAIQAANAEVEGDMDALADIQKQHTDALLKAKENEWKASRPNLNGGVGDSSMTREEIMAIKDVQKRQRAIAQNLSLFR